MLYPPVVLDAPLAIAVIIHHAARISIYILSLSASVKEEWSNESNFTAKLIFTVITVSGALLRKCC
jgi:hypothetical protein